MRKCFVSPTTPTTVHQRSSLANCTRLPSADSFGQVVFANCSLTTMTGTASFVSAGDTSRPDFNAIFIVSKYPGVTGFTWSRGASPGATGGRPSTVAGYDSPLPVSGNARTSAAD